LQSQELPRLPPREQADQNQLKTKKPVPVLPTVPTAAEANHEAQVEAQNARVEKEDLVYGNAGKRAAVAAERNGKEKQAKTPAKKYITRQLYLEGLSAAPIVAKLNAMVVHVQLLEAMLAHVQRLGLEWHWWLPWTHPVFYEVLCMAVLRPDGCVELPNAFNYVRNLNGRRVVADFDCVRLVGKSFGEACVLGCTKQQLEAFISCTWSTFDGKEQVLSTEHRSGILVTCSNV
jgi:hypothetical protein